MKYAVIRENNRDFSVRLMCRVLMVSHGGYYAWAQRKPGKRQRDDERLTTDIKRVFEKNHRRTGSIRVAKLLQHAGHKVGRSRLHSALGYLSPTRFEEINAA